MIQNVRCFQGPPVNLNRERVQLHVQGLAVTAIPHCRSCYAVASAGYTVCVLSRGFTHTQKKLEKKNLPSRPCIRKLCAAWKYGAVSPSEFEHGIVGLSALLTIAYHSFPAATMGH